MAQTMLEGFNAQLADRVAEMDALVESATETGQTWRLYRTYEGTTIDTEMGIYALTRQDDDEENLVWYGVPSNAEFETPLYAYLDNSPEKYHEDIKRCDSLLRDAEKNTMRHAFQRAFENPSENVVAVQKKHLYIVPDEDDDVSLAKMAHLDHRSFGDSALTEEEYEAIDWDELTEVTAEARRAWRREQAEGVLPDDWAGVDVLVDYDDWRQDVTDLLDHTNFSEGQAMSVAVASRNFNITQTAEILGKDTSVVSRQVNQAMDKYVKAEQTVDQMDGMNSHTLGGAYQKARDNHRIKVAEAKYERSKAPTVGFYKCPNCGLDTGAYSGYIDEGDFEAEDPPEFITGAFNHPQAGGARGGRPVQVECPECDHTGWESSFEQAWRDEHGKIPEPKYVPEPY